MNFSESLLTPKEVASRLRISEVSLWRQRKDGQLHAVKMGRRVLFERSEIDRFIKSKMEPANGK